MEKKPKILVIVTGWSNGGVEKIISNYIEYIDDFEFDVITRKRYNDESVFNDILNRNNVIIKCLYEKNIIDGLKRIKTFIINEHYDIIYVNGGSAIDMLFAIVAKKYSKDSKIIMHSHADTVENPNKFIKLLIHNIIKNIYSKRLDYRLACSENALKWMYPRNLLKNSKTQIINNGIDIEKFKYSINKRKKFRKELKIDDKTILVGTVGRFTKQKNPIYIVKIIEYILKQNSNVQFLWIGEGNLKEEIYQILKNKDMLDNVILYGPCNQVDYALSAMDVFILPSLYEGNPIVGIEAQTSGLPCVFSTTITRKSDISGLVNFIDIKDTNLIQWGDSILKSKNEDRIAFIEKIVSEKYDIESCMDKVHEILKNLI